MTTRNTKQTPIIKGGIINKIQDYLLGLSNFSKGQGFIVEGGRARKIGTSVIKIQEAPTSAEIDQLRNSLNGLISLAYGRNFQDVALNVGHSINTFIEKINGKNYYIYVVDLIFPDGPNIGDLAGIFYREEGGDLKFSGTMKYSSTGVINSPTFKSKRLDYGLGVQILIYPDFQHPQGDNFDNVYYEFMVKELFTEDQVLLDNFFAQEVQAPSSVDKFDISIQDGNYIVFTGSNGLRVGGSIQDFKEGIDLPKFSGVSETFNESFFGFSSSYTLDREIDFDIEYTETYEVPAGVKYKIYPIFRVIIDGMIETIRPDDSRNGTREKMLFQGVRFDSVNFNETMFENNSGNSRSYTTETRSGSRVFIKKFILKYIPNSRIVQLTYQFGVNGFRFDNTYTIDSIGFEFESETHIKNIKTIEISSESSGERVRNFSETFRGNVFYQTKDGIRGYDVVSGFSAGTRIDQLYFPSILIPRNEALSSSSNGLSFIDVFNENNPRILSIVRSEESTDFLLKEYGRLFKFEDYDMLNAEIGSYARFIYVRARHKKGGNYLLIMDVNNTDSVFIQSIPLDISSVQQIDEKLIGINSIGAGLGSMLDLNDLFDYQSSDLSTLTTGLTDLNYFNKKTLDGITVYGSISRNAEILIKVTHPKNSKLYMEIGKVTIDDSFEVDVNQSSVGDRVSESSIGSGVDLPLDKTELFSFEKKFNFASVNRELCGQFRFVGLDYEIKGGPAEIQAPIFEGVRFSNKP